MKNWVLLFFLILFLFNCDNTEPIEEDLPIELLYCYSIDVEEPSGLDLSADRRSLWAVSDNRGKIYKLDLTGKIQKETSISATDLEGITINSIDEEFWVVLEGQGEILLFDTNGNELQSKIIAGVRDGGGLEGITVNTNNNHLFLLKEKDPSVLIELDTNLETILYKRISSAQDYSGIDYDSQNNILWIVSDQSKKILKYDLKGNILNSYSINFDKAEGITVDIEKKLLYIVSDSADSLYIYKINE